MWPPSLALGALSALASPLLQPLPASRLCWSTQLLLALPLPCTRPGGDPAPGCKAVKQAPQNRTLLRVSATSSSKPAFSPQLWWEQVTTDSQAPLLLLHCAHLASVHRTVTSDGLQEPLGPAAVSLWREHGGVVSSRACEGVLGQAVGAGPLSGAQLLLPEEQRPPAPADRGPAASSQRLLRGEGLYAASVAVFCGRAVLGHLAEARLTGSTSQGDLWIWANGHELPNSWGHSTTRTRSTCGQCWGPGRRRGLLEAAGDGHWHKGCLQQRRLTRALHSGRELATEKASREATERTPPPPSDGATHIQAALRPKVTRGDPCWPRPW